MTFDPFFLLKKLFLKNDNNFIIPLMTVKDTSNLIKNAKNSWTICNDDLSMNVSKHINHVISPHLNHLFNTMTRTNIYPSNLKINKIVPILKPGKSKFEIGSYRPINISHPIDKLYQEHMSQFTKGRNLLLQMSRNRMY